MIFQIIGILILIFFYSVYLGKMFIQKKQGIKTDQMATKDKKGALFATELIMKIATYCIVVVEIISIVTDTYSFSLAFRVAGIITANIGNIIFATAVYTMHDNWRAGISKQDKTELVTNGIYSISRNPAFLGFYLVYIGILMMFFNWVLLVFSLFSIVMLHIQVLQEEKHLPTVFGTEYKNYCKRVCRYFGKKQMQKYK